MDIKDMKKSRKTIKILDVAATDKENLTRKIVPKKKMNFNDGSRTRIGKKEGKMTESTNKQVVDIKNNINMLKNELPQKKKDGSVSALDLISDKPSENYWEKMAESRRIALESALKENVDLHNKLSEMEYENSKLKEMLNEAQTLVEVLTEMLEGNENGGDEEEKNVNNNDNDSESETENDSFLSCI